MHPSFPSSDKPLYTRNLKPIRLGDNAEFVSEYHALIDLEGPVSAPMFAREIVLVIPTTELFGDDTPNHEHPLI
jgi:hypothetical protein